MQKTVAVLIAALFALTACSGSTSNSSSNGSSPSPGATSREEQAKANISSGLLQSSGGLGGTQLTQSQASCLADSLVGRLGVSKLQRYNLLDQNLVIRPDVNPATLDPQAAQAMATALTDCVDAKQLVFDRLGKAANRLSDAQRQCVADSVDKSALRRMLATNLEGRASNLSGTLRRKMMSCMTAGH